MNRRNLMNTAVAGTAGLLLAESVQAAQDHKEDKASRHSGHASTRPMFDCAIECAETARQCLEALQEGTGNRAAEAKLLETASGTEAICMLAARFQAEANPLAAIASSAAAQATKTCAEACTQMEKPTDQMNRCAEACKKCEEHCRGMSSTHAHGSSPRSTGRTSPGR